MQLNERLGIGMTSQRTRDRLVARLSDQGIHNIEVLDVMRSTPRHVFIDEALAHRALEDAAIADEVSLVEGLDRQGVDVARRPLRFVPKQLDWSLDSGKCHLSFVLPTGSYATVLVRELVECL